MRYLVLAVIALWVPIGSAFDRQPSPELTPTSVVEIVLAAMAENDEPTPDAGIAQAFQFASPQNKASTGPFWHFAAIVKHPNYAPLINHRSRELGEPLVEGDSATIPIVVVSSTGEVAGFMWRLSKQPAGDFANSWMTDAVERIPLGHSIKSL